VIGARWLHQAAFFVSEGGAPLAEALAGLASAAGWRLAEWSWRVRWLGRG
jgi:hypothetical protein